jgi:hypothetical protein
LTDKFAGIFQVPTPKNFSPSSPTPLSANKLARWSPEKRRLIFVGETRSLP